MKRNILIVFATAAVALIVWICVSHYSAREELLARVDRLQSWLEQPAGDRAVLWGEAEAGNAWDDYRQAVSLVAKDAHDGFRDWVVARTKGRDADSVRDAQLDVHAEALALMHRGAHRRQAICPVVSDNASGQEITSLLQARSLVNLATMQADRLLDEGRPEAAVGCLLDAMQFGRDTMQVPRLIDEMIGSALVAIASQDALITKGLLERIPSAQLPLLNEGMARLDGTLALGSRGYHGDLYAMLRAIITQETSAWQDVPFASWRYGFSAMRMVVDYADEFEALADAQLRLADTPWQLKRQHLDALQRKHEQSSNPLVSLFAANTVMVIRTRLSTIMMLRLSRMAVMHRLGQEIEALPDPFGDLLSFEQRGTKLVIWSQGSGERPMPRDRIEIADLPAAPAGR